jgi:hypothetical protein
MRGTNHKTITSGVKSSHFVRHPCEDIPLASSFIFEHAWFDRIVTYSLAIFLIIFDDYLTPSEHAITENIRSLTTLRGHNCRKQLIKIKKQRLKVNRYNKNELVKPKIIKWEFVAFPLCTQH